MWTKDTWLCKRFDCKFMSRRGYCTALDEIEVDNRSRPLPCSFYKRRVEEKEHEVIDGCIVIRDSHSIMYVREIKRWR